MWEVAYGVCNKVLHLDSLEDFNATEADVMQLKNDILIMGESRDRCKTLSLRPTFTPSSTGASSKRSTLGDTFTPSRTVVYASTLHGFGHGLGEMSPSLSRPSCPPPGILYASMPVSYKQRIFPTLTYSTVGPTMGYNFDPMMGQTLVTVGLKYLPLPFPVTWDTIPYLY